MLRSRIYRLILLICLLAPAIASADHPVLDRVRDNLNKLGLTVQQSTDVNSLIDQTIKRIDELREKPDLPADQRQAEARSIQRELRQKLGQILSPEQQQKLRDLMQSPGEPESPKDAPTEKNPPPKDSQDPKTMTGGDDTMKPGEPAMNGETHKPDASPPPSKNPNEKPKDQSPVTPPASPAKKILNIGEPAPEFSLKKLDNLTAALASYKGRVLVIEAGSWSLPIFRKHAAAMEQLKLAVGTKASFLILYTREAHPQDDWQVERNLQEKIAVDQPPDDAGRRVLAKQAKDALKITIPIAIDSMDDATATSLGIFPNGVAIIGRDGKIVARQFWTDPSGLPRLIDEAAGQKTSDDQKDN